MSPVDPADSPNPPPLDWLICFAVKEECTFFTRPKDSAVRAIVTGMGPGNAAAAIREELSSWTPKLVITAGFAGGLRSDLHRGEVVFDLDAGTGLEFSLQTAGAAPAKFHCSERVAVSIEEKSRLRDSTGADAVEMESSVIRGLCRAAGVPSATIRVISDAADEPLPLDFNALMTPDFRIDWWKFALKLMANPFLVWRLMRFQRHTRAAAEQLGKVLEAVVQRATTGAL